MSRIKIGALVVLGLALVIGGYFWWVTPSSITMSQKMAQLKNIQKTEVGSLDLSTLTYTDQKLSQAHLYDKKNASPIIGSALLDIEDNGTDEVFIGGGYSQNDTWYEYSQGEWKDITNRLGWQKKGGAATYSTATIDYDSDGDTDIFIGRTDGVFYYANNNKQGFADSVRVETYIGDEAVPTGITLADLNHDGLIDMFVSTYLRHDKIRGTTIFNDETHGTFSKLLLGKDNLIFEDITDRAGLAYRHNTFAGTFVDLDTDLDLDLVVVYDTGAARMYENKGDLSFREVLGTPWQNLYGYPMGIGVGDINQDGKQDLFFSNAGRDLPALVLKGDLRDDQKLFVDWALYENQGSLQFKDTSHNIDLAKHEFAWGGVLVDIDFNRKEDLIVSENYVKIPQQRVKPLPGRVFFQGNEQKFENVVDTFNLRNPAFSLSSLVHDWNNDGAMDILWVNIAGPSVIKMSQVPGARQTARVEVPLQSRFFGSHWEIFWADGSSDQWSFTPTEGLGSTQSNMWTFIPKGDPSTVTVYFSDGTEENGKQWYR